MTRTETPTIGRIVHYTLAETDLPDTDKNRAGECIPALVVRVWSPETGCATLTGFPDGANCGLADTLRLPSRERADEPTPGRWHWPECAAAPAAASTTSEKTAAKKPAEAKETAGAK